MQFARPANDISLGGWSGPAWSKINEIIPDDDAGYTEKTGSGTLEIGLNGVDDPGVRTGHIIQLRVKEQTGAGAKEKLLCELYDGSTKITEISSGNLTRGAYITVEHAIPEAEANLITDYNLILKFTPTQGSSEIMRLTWAEVKLPDATTEYVYSGDIPLTILPDAPKASLSKSYTGDVLLSVLPGYSSMLEKAYGGDIGLALLPASTYELVGEGPGEFVYAGDIPLIALPSCVSILERTYQGAVELSILPSSPKALLEKSYFGNLPLLIMPNCPQASLEKDYEGDIGIVLMPDAGYSLEGLLEFIYEGNIPLGFMPSCQLMMDRAYAGEMPLALMPEASYGLIIGKHVPYIFRVEPRKRVFEVQPRERIKRVDPRERQEEREKQ